MTIKFGYGGEPSSKEFPGRDDGYPELTENIKRLLPQNAHENSGWNYLEFPVNGDTKQTTRDANRISTAIRNRVEKHWGEQFKAEIRPRPEDAKPGMYRIWYRIVRK